MRYCTIRSASRTRVNCEMVEMSRIRNDIIGDTR